MTGVGPVVAEAVLQYLADEHNRETIERLRAAGVRLAEAARRRPAGALRGLTFVLTGRLPTLTRGEAQEAIEAAGGQGERLREQGHGLRGRRRGPGLEVRPGESSSASRSSTSRACGSSSRRRGTWTPRLAVCLLE